jgi:hypothetical protein
MAFATSHQWQCVARARMTKGLGCQLRLLILRRVGCMTKGQLGLLIAAVLIVSCTGSEPPLSSTPSLSPWPTPSPTRLPLPTSADLSAPNDTVVWAEVGGRLLYVSSDRGVTWKQRFLPPPGSFPLPEISFVSESEGWLLSTTVLTAQCEGQSVVLWHSTDGAHTWQPASATGISQQRCKSSVSSCRPADHLPHQRRGCDVGSFHSSARPARICDQARRLHSPSRPRNHIWSDAARGSYGCELSRRGDATRLSGANVCLQVI